MATGDEGSTPTLAEWGDKIAVGGLVLAGLLVSVCGPILRRRNETLRAELDDAAAAIDAREHALAELGADLQAHAPDVGAEDQAAAPAAPLVDLDAVRRVVEANGQAAAADQGAELP